MDADTLRIVLAVAGAFVIAGLYFWERRRNRPENEDEDEDFFDDPDREEDKREPRLGPWQEDHEPGDGGARAPSELPREGEQPGLDVKVPRSPRPMAPPEFPPGPLILTLHVVSRGEPFDGASLVHAAGRYGLEPGEMDIFHCMLGEGDHRQTLFSMANMVKPGTFPFGAMAEFQSPGVTLFAQLDGTHDDPGRMEEMLGTAHSLAEDLDGEIRDQTRRPLTREAEQQLRDRVMAFVRQRLSHPEPE